MSTNKLQSAYIVVRSICNTFYHSVRLLFHARSWSRKEVDTLLQDWSKDLLKIGRVTVRVENLHEVILEKGRPYILMSNHQSLYDIPLIFKAFPEASIRMISKKELLDIPIFGHAMKAAEMMSIDRTDSAQALKDLEWVGNKLSSGIVTWIAPEGTRSRDGQLGPFKKGGFMVAIQTKATIIPIAIRGAGVVLPAKTLNVNTDQTVEICIGRPVDASQYEVIQRNELLKIVRKEIDEMLPSHI